MQNNVIVLFEVEKKTEICKGNKRMNNAFIKMCSVGEQKIKIYQKLR